MISDQNQAVTPDDILLEIGGCGRFQFLLSTVIQTMKIVVCWSVLGSTFYAFKPNWRCADDLVGQNSSSAYTVEVNGSQHFPESVSNITQISQNLTYWNKQCHDKTSGRKCSTFEFESVVSTVSTEFDLVCDHSFVMAMAVSLQMAGQSIGQPISGQIADVFGRKKPMFLGLLILGVTHLVAIFSKDWLMFVVTRVFVGFGCGFFMTIQHNLQSEYSLAKWRSVLIGFPSWPIESSLFALVAWLLHDWKQMTMITSGMAFLFLSGWWFVPESFRWLSAHDRHGEATVIVQQVASWNKRPMPTEAKMSHLMSSKPNQTATHVKYSIHQLFKGKAMLKLTIPLMFTWLTMGVAGYGINFGIQKLSGSIYMNLFVFSITSVPSKLICIYIMNRCGRKAATVVSLSVCCIGGIAATIVQYIDGLDDDFRGQLTNYSALVANIGMHAIWGPVQTITVEVYPTVIRNIAFGSFSTMARIGAIIGPQLVFFGEKVPGLLFIIVAVTTFISILTTLFFIPETRDANLKDKLSGGYETELQLVPEEKENGNKLI